MAEQSHVRGLMRRRSSIPAVRGPFVPAPVLFVLGHDDVEAARGSEDVEHGNKFLVVIEPFSHRDNNEVIRSAGGPLG